MINQWFGGRLLKPQDRLQSQGKYFPYGEDRFSPNPANPSNDQEKFGTYTRDSATGLDYANQRYYAAGLGRFGSPDPSSLGRIEDPRSWNQYSYTRNDAVNLVDPSGLSDCDPDFGSCFSDPGDPGDPSDSSDPGEVPSDPTYRIAPVPLLHGGSFTPGAVDNATNQFARSTLLDLLKNFGDGHCAHVFRKVLGDSAYQTDDLRNFAKNTNFYDGSNPVFGDLSAQSISDNGNNKPLSEILASYGFGASIGGFVLTDSPLKYAPVIVYLNVFRLRNNTFAPYALLHELLHSYFSRKFSKIFGADAADANIISRFSSYGLNNSMGTDSITRWLSTDCGYVPTSMTYWN